MSHIQAGRWSELLRRATGQAGVEDVSSELAPEITPTWQLETNSPEWDYLKSTKRLTCNVQIDASGHPSWMLRNPIDSGTIGIVESVLISTSATDVKMTLALAYDATDLSTTGFPIVTDGRWVPLNNLPLVDPSISSLVFTIQTVGAYLNVGSLIGYFQIESPRGLNELININRAVVLPPGWALILSTVGSSVYLGGSVSYKERTLPPLEQ